MQVATNDDSLAQVLACGYREIRIPKSGATFPAFLCSLPGLRDPVWRSKRDFLLLNRGSKHILPKAAFKKLAEHAPWKRPGEDMEGQPDRYHSAMKKSLMLLDQFLQKSQRDATEHMESCSAWEKFCLSTDTEDLIDTRQQHDDSSISATSKQISSQLGQYFCTPENAMKVVSLALGKLGSQVLNDEKQRLLFVEPSCGHGDVLEALVSQLSESNVASNRVAILAFDIDPNAIEKSRERKLSAPIYSITYVCHDFLGTTRPSDCQGQRIVCIGGPPYTTGQGNLSNIQRDLPARFVHHCIEEWGAYVVSFLMPARYRKAIIDVTNRYQCETLELESSTFYFQGETQVTQPSIAQCYFEK